MAGKSFKLEKWAERHRNPFAEMHFDAVVMADLGGPFDRPASDEKFYRYQDAWKLNGISRWAIADPSGRFLGYVGVMKRSDPDHPLGPHYEIGWRLCSDAWGNGYATEGARQALGHAWSVIEADEIVCYTAADNLRCQNVIERLNLRRDAARDFTAKYPRGAWNGLLWVSDRPLSE